MSLKIRLLFLLSALIRLSLQSIAGVTFMDHFDFEQRYRNVYECDPLHWYPLHLPPHCARMYEDLIRNGVTKLTNTPVRIVKKSESVVYNLNPSVMFSSLPLYGTEDSQEEYEMSPLSPYEKMFQMLRADVMQEPSAPVITNMPGLGAVALYRQPISRKSGQYIKKISGTYRDAYIKHYDQNNPTTTAKPATDKIEDTPVGKVKATKVRTHNQDKPKFNIKQKIKNGNIVTVLRSMRN